MKNTNFQMLLKLDKEFTPKERHIISDEEIGEVKKALCLDEMDLIDLCNLRDFTVMFYDQKTSKILEKARETSSWDLYDATTDKMSAITSVIDLEKIRLGGEV